MIISGKEFFKGGMGEVQPMTDGLTIPAKSERARVYVQQAEAADVEAKRIASLAGQTKEVVKQIGEFSGLLPTGRRIAAGIAPVTEKSEDLANVVEELAGGVSQPRKMGGTGQFLENVGLPTDVAEGVDIALDLPIISLGLSKNISKYLAEQAPKVAGKEALQILDKPLFEFLPDTLKSALRKDITTPIKETVGDITERVGGAFETAKTTLFGKAKQPGNIEEVIQQADEALKPSEVLAKTEQETAKPSLLERWAGVSPDIKNRIAGKQDKLKEYFDVAHARNNFDTLPTPLEHGAKNVGNAASTMERILNDTGSDIGKFRKKVGTYEANIVHVRRIESAFNSQLTKLNLEIKNGIVREIPGKVRRVNSENEIKVLNDLYGELQTVKQNPNLEKLIDLRTLFDNKINFEKSVRQVSNSLDPLSRTVRKQIADVAAGIVGKSEAGKLTKYSEFIDAYNQLRSFTDRKAGSEFLLKQVLSERGRTPREVMRTIKEFTGIDLQDDAVMASIATDLIGNARQKGLFRQEIIKAGLDVEAILKGDTSGAIKLMENVIKRTLINEEKQFLKAAK